MGWATTSALGGWPLVRSPSVMDELRELSPTGGGSATCVDLSGRPQGSYDSAVSPTHVLRSGLSRSQEVTRTELVEAATIRDAIFRSTKAPPRTPLGMSVRNWCHFTVPPRPRTRPPIQQGAPSGYFVASLSVGVGRPTCRTRDPAGVEVCAC